ncbi:MAG: ribosomal subunit interface protein [Nitrospiraceae bacterium]|jgi:putative sigma-54 modulation protein|nr:ribosomal subunit interface protein [Nitrospiraceae bacterium]|tara:strand:+ start:464 stop:991 length:528 start_codon:yes stop_codon:yes gene_type:complete
MTINLTGKQVVLDEALRQYVDKKVEKLGQYGAKLHDVHIMLAMEKYRALADISVNVGGHAVVAKAETKTLYRSIDGVMEKIERQLMRYRGKLLGVKTRHAGAPTESLRDGSGVDSNHLGIKTRTISVALASAEKALEAMASFEDNCMVFSDERTARFRIVHRRPDGEVEILDPLT